MFAKINIKTVSSIKCMYLMITEMVLIVKTLEQIITEGKTILLVEEKHSNFLTLSADFDVCKLSCLPESSRQALSSQSVPFCFRNANSFRFFENST